MNLDDWRSRINELDNRILQLLNQRVDSRANLSFSMLGGDKEPQASGAFFDCRMQNRLNVDAAMIHGLGSLQRMQRVAEDDRHDWCIFTVPSVQTVALGERQE